ncbi:hypothetical protein P7K49_031085, partial [Saguinus oedipus]
VRKVKLLKVRKHVHMNEKYARRYTDGTPSQLQDANLYKHAAVPDINNACTVDNHTSYVTCRASHILPRH